MNTLDTLMTPIIKLTRGQGRLTAPIPKSAPPRSRRSADATTPNARSVMALNSSTENLTILASLGVELSPTRNRIGGYPMLPNGYPTGYALGTQRQSNQLQASAFYSYTWGFQLSSLPSYSMALVW